MNKLIAEAGADCANSKLAVGHCPGIRSSIAFPHKIVAANANGAKSPSMAHCAFPGRPVPELLGYLGNAKNF